MIEGSGNPHQNQRTRRLLGVVLLVGVLFYFYLLSTNNKGISVAVKDDYMSLSCSSGESFDIRFKDILSVTEIQDLDLGNYISGTETKCCKCGVWRNGQFGEYNLCIHAGMMRYIVVETSNGIFVLNLEGEDETDSFYKAFVKLLQTKRAETAPCKNSPIEL